jgi:sulfite oxidase
MLRLASNVSRAAAHRALRAATRHRVLGMPPAPLCTSRALSGGRASFHGSSSRGAASFALGGTALGAACVLGLGAESLGPRADALAAAASADPALTSSAAGDLPADHPLSRCGQRRPDLPTFTRAEVAERCTQKTGIWVTYREGVYDITEFVNMHPGGAKRIMLAAGRAVDPFWKLYQQHLAEGPGEFIAKALSSMRVGNVAEDEPPPVDLDDPYKDEPKFGEGWRSAALKVHTERAFNAEAPVALIGEDYITPTGLFYCRHHHPVPKVDAEAYRLEIVGPDDAAAGGDAADADAPRRGGPRVRPLSLSLEDLRRLFPKRTVVMTLQCAGNRRSGFEKVRKTQGLKWGSGAISTAEFGGVWLRDVLRLAGVEDLEAAEAMGAEHVRFEAIDEPYDASIPCAKALDRRGDVLLAYEMNGRPLPREHGFPVRVMVPGHLGARSVKWVRRIRVSPEEALSTWQRGVAYRGFGPHVRAFDASTIDEEGAPAVQELPVQSAITNLSEGDVVDADEGDSIEVKGYAWSGGGRRIIRVDVSADGGATWRPAKLREGADQPPGRAWAWTLWEAEVVPDAKPCADGLPEERPEGERRVQLCVKAVDESYNTQPETPAPIWNLRGIMNNSWDRVNVVVRGEGEEGEGGE